jgi:mono/diheme cytochrome c family protein
MRRPVTTLVLLLLLPGILHAADGEPRLRFVDDGVLLRALGLGALIGRCGETRVEVDDPYYERPMAFRAVPLRCVLEAGFDAEAESLSADDFSLIALDGYTRPATGARLAEAGGHLAFADASLTPAGAPPRFAPITRRELDPAPFYLVWAEPGQNDTHRYPWPFQLGTIERVPFERRHPHTLPSGEAEGAAAWRGFALFRSQCVMCHSVNGEGGKVGPELNVPRSIVEYRPEGQLREFIRDPESFRYTAMPSHEHLGEADLDALIAYFRAMSARKYDPRATPAP